MTRTRLLRLAAYSVFTLVWLPLAGRAQASDPSETGQGAGSYHRLGMAQADEGRYGEAVKNLERALAVRPDFALAYNDLGYVYYVSRKFEEAVKAYLEAI